MAEPLALTAIAILANEPPGVADEAFLECLLQLRADRQRRIFDLILARRCTPVLAKLIGMVQQLPEPLRTELVDRLAEFPEALEMAATSPELETRLCAVGLIGENGAPKLAYLLGGAVHGSCLSTREVAARSLLALTKKHVASSISHTAGAPKEVDAVEEIRSPSCAEDSHPAWLEELPEVLPEALPEALPDEALGSVRLGDGNAVPSLSVAQEPQADALICAAVAEALRHWDTHFLPAPLEAAMWMPEQMMGVILEKLADSRGRLVHMLHGVMSTRVTAPMAAFIVRALGVDALQQTAASVVSSASDRSLQRAILQEWSRLRDAPIERGCRWIRQSRWLHETVDDLLDAGAGLENDAVDLVLAGAIAPERRLAQLQDIAEAGGEHFAKAVRQRLAEFDDENSLRVLAILHQRASLQGREIPSRVGRASGGHTNDLGANSGLPKQVVLSRSSEAIGGDATRSGAAEANSETTNWFDELWLGAQRGEADSFEFRHRFQSHLLEVAAGIRVKLVSVGGDDRALALHIIRTLGAACHFEKQIYRLAFDHDARIRSAAVAMLADVPGMISERILRTALDDLDARVQANAIEAMDQMEMPGRSRWTERKLGSPNARVRGNAIRSLLRLEVRSAADDLLAMLGDSSRAQRLSALWVVGDLSLTALVDMVAKLAASDTDPRVRLRAQEIMGRFVGKGGPSTTDVRSQAARLNPGENTSARSPRRLA